MTTTHLDRHTVVLDGPTVRRRLGWLIAAIVSAWMTATIMAVVAVALGVVLERDAAVITMVSTGVLAALLFGHFWRMSHIDEPLVLGLLFCWAVTLGLLSL